MRFQHRLVLTGACPLEESQTFSTEVADGLAQQPSLGKRSCAPRMTEMGDCNATGVKRAHTMTRGEASGVDRNETRTETQEGVSHSAFMMSVGCSVGEVTWHRSIVINTFSQLVESQLACYFILVMMMPSLMLQWRYRNEVCISISLTHCKCFVIHM